MALDPIATALPRAGAGYLRAGVSHVWRRLPRRLRRRWRYVDPINRAMLYIGAPVVATAQMRGGHQLRLDLRSGTEWFAYYTGVFDDGRIRAARELMCRQPGGVAVDAGANIGFWTIPLALQAAASHSRVVAVEPVVANARRLRENLELNDISDYVDVWEHALSDAAGTVMMTLREDFADGAGTGNAAVAVDDGTDDQFAHVEVATRTLDDTLDACGRAAVRVVKADIEGHEDHLLAGAHRTFCVDRPVAFLEWNRVYYERRGVDATALTAPLLRDWEYRCLRQRDGRWVAATCVESELPLDDVVLVPAERQAEVMELLSLTMPGGR
ncbi:MAG: methyltransferase, FkbM family [Sphaerisporangium sp.]|nr:methyltransferase, FkbM family [Sphaerisporangium sp.]